MTVNKTVIRVSDEGSWKEVAFELRPKEWEAERPRGIWVELRGQKKQKVQIPWGQNPHGGSRSRKQEILIGPSQRQGVMGTWQEKQMVPDRLQGLD